MNKVDVSISNAINNMVSITQFNRGEAARIFQEVRDQDKIVLKNNQPTCILVEPQRYQNMIETIEDFALFTEANERLGKVQKRIDVETIMERAGITEASLEEIDVEIE